MDERGDLPPQTGCRFGALIPITMLLSLLGIKERKEYQIDVNPDAMRAFGVTLEQIFKAVKDANMDVGARSIEINRIEYVIRGRGFLTSLDDLRETAVTARGDIPITLDEVADINFGPALRRGVLDKAGAEAVGGVVVPTSPGA